MHDPFKTLKKTSIGPAVLFPTSAAGGEYQTATGVDSDYAGGAAERM
jgi:hypothetical protein